MAAHTRKRNTVFSKNNGSQCTVTFFALERKKQSLPPESIDSRVASYSAQATRI
jgi:hypothetical protein